MNHQQLQLLKSTLAVTAETANSTAFMLPKGAVITVVDEPVSNPPDPPKVLVQWDGKLYRMFLTDLHERAENIYTASESPQRL